MKQVFFRIVIVASMSIVVHGPSSLAQTVPSSGRFKSEADSLRWWKYQRFRNINGGHTKEEQEILNLMGKRNFRIQMGTKVRVLIRDASGQVLSSESFWGKVVRQRHQVFYTVRDSLGHDYEYHLFDIDLPKEEIPKETTKVKETNKSAKPSSPGH